MAKEGRHHPEKSRRRSHEPGLPDDDTFEIICCGILLIALGIGLFVVFFTIFGISAATKRTERDRVSGTTGLLPRGFRTPSFTPPKKKSLEEYQHLCGGRMCKVAVVACASSRGIDVKAFNGMALIKLMIPSLMRTVETDLFAYAVYIGIDEDDLFWNSPSNKKRLKDFVKSKMSGKSMGGRVVSFPQPSVGGKRIPMNEIINVAYKDGADYIVRINDDTEFVTNEWTSAGVGTLLAMNPPNVGVVGPTCFDGNEEILTHDMVHRTHIDIFKGKYYPPVFKNWFLDDWITKVYGEKRTRKIPSEYWEVKHHIYHHGTRYTATGDQWMVDDELRKGKRNIDEWLKSHKTTAETSR